MWEGCFRQKAKYELIRKCVWVQEFQFQVPLWDVSGVERNWNGERRIRCGTEHKVFLPVWLERKLYLVRHPRPKPWH